MITKKRKKLLALCLSLAMLISVFPMPTLPTQEAKAAGYGISNPRTDENGVSTWDCVYFGNYWRNDNDGDGIADQKDSKEPIKWRVLSVVGDNAFLLADECIDAARPYNTEFTFVTWETCTLRNWLNNDFYNAAFSDEEKSAIETTEVKTEDNPFTKAAGGNDTEDKVYLLSMQEATNPLYGFSSDCEASETREAKSSEYAKKRANWTDEINEANGGNGWWQSRTPGTNSEYVVGVGNNGLIYKTGGNVDADYKEVRPVLHLNLSSDKWEEAGTVSASGGSISASEATVKPDITPAPTATVEPVTTPAPTATVKPVTTPAPTVTVKPDITQAPEATVKPVTTQAPEAAVEPVTTQAPGTTVKPVATQEPTATIKPTTGPKTVTAPGKVQKLKAKNNKKKSVTLSWKKVSGAKGYQVQCAANKKFKRKQASELTSRTKFTVKKLKKKKIYYFRVRAYKLNGKKKVYGKWSAVKKVKVKK